MSSIKSDKEQKENKNRDRIQKAYFIDKDLFKALQLKCMQEEINLTEAINKVLRIGLNKYL
jgi:UTP-glucose-1-phosphate uridylyltransferase